MLVYRAHESWHIYTYQHRLTLSNSKLALVIRDYQRIHRSSVSLRFILTIVGAI